MLGQKVSLAKRTFCPHALIRGSLAYHEMRIILAKVLWHFDLELCAESERWANHKIFLLWEKPALYCRLKPVKHDA
jgi:hypothetical protein